MPLLDQLKEFSDADNSRGVCLINSAITAHVLMSGPDALLEQTTLSLPLSTGEVEELDLVGIKAGKESPGATLDVTELPDGEPDAWSTEAGHTPADNGKSLLTWLASSEAKAGVYLAVVGDEESDHYFNVVKTDEGKLYLMDASQHCFIDLRGPSDLNIAVRKNADRVPFTDMYCHEKMKLDYCGALHPDCRQALKFEVRRTVAQEIGMKPSVSSGAKATVKVA